MGVGRLERGGRAESLLHNANKSTLKDGQMAILVAFGNKTVVSQSSRAETTRFMRRA